MTLGTTVFLTLNQNVAVMEFNAQQKGVGWTTEVARQALVDVVTPENVPVVLVSPAELGIKQAAFTRSDRNDPTIDVVAKIHAAAKANGLKPCVDPARIALALATRRDMLPLYPVVTIVSWNPATHRNGFVIYNDGTDAGSIASADMMLQHALREDLRKDTTRPRGTLLDRWVFETA